MTRLNGIKIKGNETFDELLKIGKAKDNSILICKAKKCNNILRPDWTSRIDKRYCKDCLE